MKIYIGADHRGFQLKESLKKWMYENGYEYEDVGAYELDPEDDYPIYAERVARKLTEDFENAIEALGIVTCGSGVGVDIVINKFKQLRSGLCSNVGQVKSARRDDNINVLAIPADFVSQEESQGMLKAFLETNFDSIDRHSRRIREIDEIENEQ